MSEDMPKKVFICNECEMIYSDERDAQQCEEFCKKYKACNMKIIQKAIGKMESNR